LTDPDDLAGAQGKLVVFLASVLQRAGVVQMGEFANLLGIFADTVADTDPNEAALLKAWAGTIRGPHAN
jgi:hypothetical protein